MNIENALRATRPEPVFHGRLFTREDYETGIVWEDARPKPSWDDLIASDAAITAENDAKELAKMAELTDIEELRAEYGLANLKEKGIKELKAVVKDQIKDAGGLARAVEQLAISVALLERKIYGKL